MYVMIKFKSTESKEARLLLLPKKKKKEKEKKKLIEENLRLIYPKCIQHNGLHGEKELEIISREHKDS